MQVTATYAEIAIANRLTVRGRACEPAAYPE